MPCPDVRDEDDKYHVIPTWQTHETSEDCRCCPYREWFQLYDGSWSFVVVHNEGH